VGAVSYCPFFITYSSCLWEYFAPNNISGVKVNKILSIVLIFSSSITYANTIKINQILSPVSHDDVFLILGSDAQVYEVNKTEIEIIDLAKTAYEFQDEVELTLSKNKLRTKRDTVIGLEITNLLSVEKSEVASSIPTPLDIFNVTMVTPSAGKKMFDSMNNGTRRRSQCYNRAHVWAYEIYKKYSTSQSKMNLGKVWIFFTQDYIRDFKHKWWFHIAPYTQFQDSVKTFVMDRSYNKKPIPLKEWTDIFMKNDAQCKEVKFYSHYRANQQNESCFIIKSSMYYWQPFNIENLEKGEAEKTRFDMEELEKAYKNAIRRWDGEIL
jgi:hypothetical protein